MSDRVIKIAAMVGNVLDGCSWYRSGGPFSRMMSQYPLQVTFSQVIGWNEILAADIVFLQKAAEPNAVLVARMATSAGKPLWIDYDDDVPAVPTYSPCWTPDTGQLAAYIAELSSMSQAMTVSTPTLLAAYKDLAKNVILIPNAMDLQFYETFKVHRMPTEIGSKKRVALWRGSGSQVENLRMLLPVVRRSLDQFPDLLWVLHCPMRPFNLSPEHSKRVLWIGWQNIPECFITPLEYCPDIVVSALFDTAFDRARSENAAMESIMAGAVPVCPTWWEIPGAFHYTPGDLQTKPLIEYTEAEMKHASGNLYKILTTALKASPDQLKARHIDALKHIHAEHSLDEVNKRRWSLIQALVAAKPAKVCILQKAVI